MAEKRDNKRKTLKGKVVSNKMEKTVKVLVETKQAHPVYRKVVNYRKAYYARANNPVNEGDIVTIMESKPYSKKVRWIVVKDENGTEGK